MRSIISDAASSRGSGGAAGAPVLPGALDQSGYTGWYELEIFSDDGRFGNDYDDSLWKLDPVELVRAGRSKFEDAWRNRRLVATA